MEDSQHSWVTLKRNEHFKLGAKNQTNVQVLCERDIHVYCEGNHEIGDEENSFAGLENSYYVEVNYRHGSTIR